MSDLFYHVIWQVGSSAFWISSKPTIYNVEVTRRQGAYILASNHQSPYDVPLLIRHTKRMVDFVSIVEVFKVKPVAWFYGSMNAFPVDRSKPDSPTVRVILDRLSRGRVIGFFPEGQFRPLEKSVVTGGTIRKGIGRIALLAKVPVIPCVVVNSKVYSKIWSWMPHKRCWYGLNYGQPLEIDTTLPPEAAATDLETRLCASFRALYDELKAVQPSESTK